MQCFFKDTTTVHINIDTNTHYKVYEDDLLIYTDYYTSECDIKISYKDNKNYFIEIDNIITEIDYDGIYDTDIFNKYNYDDKLGVIITTMIELRLWAPLKKKIELIIYKGNKEYIFDTTKENGVFKVNIDKHFLNSFYMYKVYTKSDFIISIDPYANCVIDDKGYLIDINKTNKDIEFLKRSIPDNKRIIYELNVNDFTKDLNNNNFLGLIEDSKNLGFNHLIELGITDIQLLPIFDYEHNNTYNWGYMPINYNALTQLYSQNKYNAINEFKTVIKQYHRNNIGIIMDVVYNHTSFKSSFDSFVPGYFYRKHNNYYCNASGCGNEIASTRFMVRKYITDSILHWADEYKLSGFRFDLMAILDIDTIKDIITKLKALNSEILIYGEPWSASPPQIPLELQCVKENIDKIDNLYYFNDILRDAIKGSVFSTSSKGFVQGNYFYKNIILEQLNYNTINYVSCHDNHTLYDKLCLSSDGNIISQQKQANAIILLSNGISFLHSGVEFCRSKNKIENSYNSSIEINKINWNNKNDYYDCFTYYKNLIKFKSKIKNTSIEVFDFNIDSILSYKIDDYIVIHNSNKNQNIFFDKIYVLKFHLNECNVEVTNLYLEENNTYIIKEKD